MTAAYFDYDDIDIESLTSDEASRLRDELISQMGDINVQLSERNVLVDGERLSGNEFWAWRRSAVAAKNHKEKLATALRRRAHEARMEERATTGQSKARWLRASLALLDALENGDEFWELIPEFRYVIEQAEQRAR